MKYVQSCDQCQRNKVPTRSAAGLLKPLPIPEERFKTVAMDFMELPTSRRGSDQAMIVVDKLSKLVQIIAMKKTDGAREAATLFLDRWVCSGKGLPEYLISDRDSRFTSTFWNTLMERLRIKLIMSTARHQQTNGQAEHAVKMAKACLRSFVDYKGKNWDELIPQVEYALNNSISSTTGYTPFKLAYGLDPDQTLAIRDPDLALAIQEKIDWARLQMAIQQDKMEEIANKDRSLPPPIKIGDRVLLKRDGINWPAESQSDMKLLPKYLGPFFALEEDDHGNLKLELPAVLRIHPWFARDVLKPYYEPNEYFPQRHSPAPVKELYSPETEYEIEKILDHRLFRNQRQFLIRWQGYGPEHDTWEPADIHDDEKPLVDVYQQSKGGVINWVKPTGKRVISHTTNTRDQGI